MKADKSMPVRVLKKGKSFEHYGVSDAAGSGAANAAQAESATP
jgi:hypothetical protein